MKAGKRLQNSRSGASLVEFVLLVSLIAIICIVSVRKFGRVSAGKAWINTCRIQGYKSYSCDTWLNRTCGGDVEHTVCRLLIPRILFSMSCKDRYGGASNRFCD